MPHTFLRVVLPALPLRPFCLPKVRASVKLSFSMATTEAPCCLAHLTSWLTASRRAPRRWEEEPFWGISFLTGRPTGVAVRIQDAGVQMSRVHIHRQAPARLCGFLHRRSVPLSQRPGGGDVPTVPLGVEANRVAHRLVRGDLGSPLVSQVVPTNRVEELVGGDPARSVGQVRQRRRQADSHGAFPVVSGGDPDGLVSPGLASLAVGGEEHPPSVPPFAPLRLGETGRFQVVALAGQALAADGYGHAAIFQTPLGFGQPRSEFLAAAGLLITLRAGRVAPLLGLPGAHGEGQAAAQLGHLPDGPWRPDPPDC